MSELILDTSRIPTTSFSVADGQREKILLPLHTHLFDGPVEYIDSSGELQKLNKFSECDKNNERIAIKTFIRNGAGEEIFYSMIDDYLKSLETNPTATAFVVTYSQVRAKKLGKLAEELGINHRVAISEDKESLNNIEAFKVDPSVKLLIGVGQIHEGLNVPCATHIAYLTNFRTFPHAQQVIGRVTRVDRSEQALPYERQCAHLYAPKDPLLLKLIEKMKASDGHFALETTEVSEDGGEEKRQRAYETAQGLSSKVASSSVYDFASGQAITTAQITAILAAAGTPLTEDQRSALEKLPSIKSPSPEQPAPTPSQEREHLRTAIEQGVRQLAAHQGLPPEDLNRNLKSKFGKGRGDMTVDDLKAVYKFVAAIADNAHLGLGGVS